MTKLTAERGMSLVEATIILLVLATLTAVIAPSMGDYLEDARIMKVKEDTESLGIGIVRLLRDTGLKGLKLNAATAFTKANRVDLLVSDGDDPGFPAGSTLTGFVNGDTINWSTATNADAFEDQLVRNALTGTNYSVPTQANRGRGWRGSYVNTPIGADPWGYKYYASTVFLTVATDSTAGTGNGQASGFWTNDVVVLSAGPDNIIQNTVAGSAGGGAGVAGSDDHLFVLQGNTR